MLFLNLGVFVSRNLLKVILFLLLSSLCIEMLQLWNTLTPDEPLEQRYTRQWGDIGFQGTDPASDFRGMGLLGFYNLM